MSTLKQAAKKGEKIFAGLCNQFTAHSLKEVTNLVPRSAPLLPVVTGATRRA